MRNCETQSTHKYKPLILSLDHVWGKQQYFSIRAVRQWHCNEHTFQHALSVSVNICFQLTHIFHMFVFKCVDLCICAGVCVCRLPSVC